jgi:hypothetical protein
MVNQSHSTVVMNGWLKIGDEGIWQSKNKKDKSKFG